MPTAAFPAACVVCRPLMQVLDERRARGIADTVGRDASPVCDSRDKHTRARSCSKS